MQRASFWSSGSSCLLRWAKKGSVHGAMIAMITWAEGVISVAEPPIMSVCSGSVVVVGSGLVLPVSPCHTTDGLNNLSKKMLGGGDYIAFAPVRTPIPSHIDLAGNTSYHFAASRTVSHGCRLTMARDHLHLLAHVYDSVASIHMTENPG